MLEQLQEPLVQQVLFEDDDKGQGTDSTHGHGETNLAQIRLLVAQEQRPISHEGQRKQGELRKLRSDWATGRRDQRHYLCIAKAMPPGDGDPEEPQHSGEQWEVVNSASLVGAARDGSTQSFPGECVENTGNKN